jgi:hypothetical protein
MHRLEIPWWFWQVEECKGPPVGLGELTKLLDGGASISSLPCLKAAGVGRNLLCCGLDL